MTAVNQLDALSGTFTCDQRFCDVLFTSNSARQAAELLLSHLWANKSLPACYKALQEVVPATFGEARVEHGRLWTLVFLESLSRELRLVPYLVFRGLPTEAGNPLRRAYEDIGVLTHIWRDPKKLDALGSPQGAEYRRAFRVATAAEQKLLKEQGLNQRFSAMRSGKAAKDSYRVLSELYIHGGSGYRVFSEVSERGPLTCSFAHRPDVDGKEFAGTLTVLTESHKLICAEILGLCADFAERSDDLQVLALALREFLYEDSRPGPVLQDWIDDLLQKIGSDEELQEPWSVN